MLKTLSKKMKSIFIWTALTGIVLAVIKALFHGCWFRGKGTESFHEEETVPEKKIVNINTAGVEELASIPHISLPVAQNIVAYREENGLFSGTDELLNVKGIGEKMLGLIEEYICSE